MNSTFCCVYKVTRKMWWNCILVLNFISVYPLLCLVGMRFVMHSTSVVWNKYIWVQRCYKCDASLSRCFLLCVLFNSMDIQQRFSIAEKILQWNAGNLSMNGKWMLWINYTQVILSYFDLNVSFLFLLICPYLSLRLSAFWLPEQERGAGLRI